MKQMQSIFSYALLKKLMKQFARYIKTYKTYCEVNEPRKLLVNNLSFASYLFAFLTKRI